MVEFCFDKGKLHDIHNSMVRTLPRHVISPCIVEITYPEDYCIDNTDYITQAVLQALKGYLINDDTRKSVLGLVQLFHGGHKKKLNMYKNKIIVRVIEA